jgi:biotin transport system substrate-specific component
MTSPESRQPSSVAAILRAPRASVLADPVAGSWVANAALIVAYAAFVGLAAQVSIRLPFTPVPITGQTFAVLAGGLALGWRRSAAGMALYLVAGVAGLPWFASAQSGLSPLTLPSLGYIVGYIPAGALVGWLAERRFGRSPLTTVAALVAGSAVIYAFGVTWLALAIHVGPWTALQEGMFPFLAGDALKAALAAGVLPLAWIVTRRR